MVGKVRSVDMFDFDPMEGQAEAAPLSGVWESSQVCPSCGASEEEAPGTISYSSYDGEYREIWQDARCSRCDAAWSESYYLQGASGDGEGGFAVLAGSLLDAAFDVLASGGDGLSLRTLGDAVITITGQAGRAELERRKGELQAPCLCGERPQRACGGVEGCALTLDACPGCGGSGEYILTTWAPVYVTVSDGQVTRVRVNDEALDVRGLDGMPSYVTCAGCDARQGDATADAVRATADGWQDWPGWEFGA